MDLILPHGWAPRPHQEALWTYLTGGGKRAVVCAHRRWGKDDVGLHFTACAAHLRVGNYGHMLPEYAQGRKAIWDAVNPHSGKKRIDEAFPAVLRAAVNDQEMKIRFRNGSTWQVLGSDNYNSLMGTSYAGIIKSEEALSNPAAWAYLSPILRENDGWAVFISTARGHNHFESMLQMAQREVAWYAELAPANQTGVYTPEELEEERRLLQATHGVDYGNAIWLQEYFCSFDAAIPGSIWGDCVTKAERDGRIVDFPMDRQHPVYTAWDLGRTDDTAIWWYQFNGTRLDIFDYHSSSLKDIPFYIDLLKAKQAHYGLTYARHYLPHDARPRTLAGGGKSILQQCEDLAKGQHGLGSFVIGKRLDVQEGIQAARATFPVCRFHKTACHQGLECLRQYHREFDEEKKMFLDHPTHDWASHGADAFRYLSLSWKRTAKDKPESPLIDRLHDGNVGNQPWKDIVARHFSKKRRQQEARA